MDETILSISERGQITIPQKIRNKYSVKHFVCHLEEGNIVLKPLKTREEFIKELENSEKDWEKNGGLTLAEIKKKYKV